ncbi:hypothetical protein niasHT_026432 [Heterodera trifolii]|uniref:Ion transport domain-containing protein n=1 Tax=Heterodera trifolii TaxID=157864 RepID=A0ABD2KKL9_9BILA
MLQQPVAKELRSFKNLSKYSQKRGGGGTVRRQSVASSRKQSMRRHTLRRRGDRAEEAEWDEPVTSRMSELSQHRMSAKKKPEWEERRQIRDEMTELGRDELEEEEEEGAEEEGTHGEGHDQMPFPEYEPVVLNCLGQSVPPRSWALRMVTNPWFDRITMLVIILNCVTLGMYRPCEDGHDCRTYRCWLLSLVDHAIFVYFGLEMLVKIVALGFFGEVGYLGDTWNRLDFFIVLAGVAEYLLQEYLGNINLTAIRTVRVLRPLRAVNRIPSMRILVNLLLDTLPMLGNVLLLCFFVFFIFGIVGVQLWAGLLRNRCVISLPSTELFTLANGSASPFGDVSLSRYYIPMDTSLDYICSPGESGGLHNCQNLPPFVLNGQKCNLTLQKFRWDSEIRPKSERDCVNWNLYYSECRVMHKNPFQGSVSFDNIGFAWVAIFLVISLEGWTDIMYYVQDAHSFWNWIYFVLLIVIGAFFMVNLCLVVIATQFAETKRRETERMLEERRQIRSNSLISSSDFAADSLNGQNAAGNATPAGDSVYAAIVHELQHWCRRGRRWMDKRWRKRKKARGERENDETERADRENEERRECEKWRNGSIRSQITVKRGQNAKRMAREGTTKWHRWGSKLSTFRGWVKNFVTCDHFTRGILIAILVNTLSMGVEYHQQPELLTTMLEYSNIFFTALFAFEMLLKVLAVGLFGYLSDGFNLFDGGIVALSVLELFQEGKGGLSVLRTFRLLRILKLVSHFAFSRCPPPNCR